jgi:hypothetical protein
MENGVSNICPSISSPSVTVKVKISSLVGTKLAENVGVGEAINFDVKAMMDEKERRSGQISVGYSLKVGTKPNVAKYEVEGTAVLEGRDEEIKKMLEVNPETGIPFVFQRVYQHIFMSMYLLSTLINAPYPPPSLLPSGEQPTPVIEASAAVITPQATNATQPTVQPTVQPAVQSTTTGNVPQKEKVV